MRASSQKVRSLDGNGLGHQVPAEGEGVGDQQVQALHAVLEALGQFQLGRLGLEVLHQHAREQGQTAQGIPDLVGQFRRHEPHGLQAFLPGGLLGAQMGLGDVPEGDDLAGGGGSILLLHEVLPALRIPEVPQP